MLTQTDATKTPVTVFTGYLGSGKTTIILNLLKQLPKDYKLVLLKNEFGDMAIDSELAKEASLQVTEMLNGCLCCVLVGKLQYALEEILAKYTPDRIIIETSGSAYPAPIAWEVRKMGDRLHLDSIITVIDALNFKGYKDKSYTAKLQAEYTDIILINKHELVPEAKLDKTLDDVYELNPVTPKIKTDHGKIDPDLIFGLDTNLFEKVGTEEIHDHDHQKLEAESINFVIKKTYTFKQVEDFLSNLPKWDFFRLKGVLQIEEKFFLMNYVFGRFDFVELNRYSGEGKVLVLGKNLQLYYQLLKEFFS